MASKGSFLEDLLCSQHRALCVFQEGMSGQVTVDHLQSPKCPFQVAFMPLYHWTDSKVRIHAFVCMAALTCLTILRNRLAQAGLRLSPREFMEQLRSVRTAIYLMASQRKPRRILEETTPTQLAILRALGFQIKDNRVVQVS